MVHYWRDCQLNYLRYVLNFYQIIEEEKTYLLAIEIKDFVRLWFYQ